MHFTKGVEKRFPKLFPKGSFEFKILRGYEIFYNEIRKDKRRVVTVSFCDSFLWQFLEIGNLFNASEALRNYET